MENATEALKMAGGVLIFVLALSICINAFTNTRQGIDNLVLYSDREFLTTYVEQNKGTKRIVGAESIVPTIYRAYKENIKINFQFSENQESDIKPLYTVSSYGSSDEDQKIYSIDLDNQVHGSEKQREFFLYNILYGSDNIKGPNQMYSNDKYDEYKATISNITFNGNGLYQRLTNGDLMGTYEESLGVYFPTEKDGTTDKSTTNKTEKKVITYKKVNE